jgi:hypothetical protein
MSLYYYLVHITSQSPFVFIAPGCFASITFKQSNVHVVLCSNCAMMLFSEVVINNMYTAGCLSLTLQKTNLRENLKAIAIPEEVLPTL